MQKNFIASVVIAALSTIAQGASMPKLIECNPSLDSKIGMAFRYDTKTKMKCSIGRQNLSGSIDWTDLRCQWLDQDMQYEFDLEIKGKNIFRIEISKDEMLGDAHKGFLIGDWKGQKFDHEIACHLDPSEF